VPPSIVSRAALVGALALCLTACSSTDAPTPGSESRLSIAAAFYPLEYIAERIGGEQVEVIPLAPPGVEPHDMELSPAGVRGLRDSDVTLYLSGFQPSVDDAIASTGASGLDAAESVPLVDADPHFWLDPTLLAGYAEAVTEEFAALDPEHADLYRANNSALASDLVELDALLSEGLTGCERDTILVSHEAFGYLASRYGLTQVGLSGIDPEAEPSPARIREVRDLAESIGATTVFVETLVDPSVVEAFARDAGLEVSTLDPVESATGTDDYLVIMRRNLDAMEAGLGCG
jgi:zinc transport system substrate-binding protein